MSFSTVLASAGNAGGVPPLLIVPFGLLLLLIASMPLTPHRVKHFWEHYYPHISVFLGLLVAGYYLVWMPDGLHAVEHTLIEYVSFIALIGSLFIVSGGVLLRVKGGATPGENIKFLAWAALVTDIIGTTGASMVLIRPWIRMNKVRISAFHIVFFIFIVSNCGGALTPVGDPPLFMGFLRGVPFFWLLAQVWLQWLAVIVLLLTVFYFFDLRSFRKAAPIVQAKLEEHDRFRIEGKRNLVLLAVVVGAVFIPGSIFLLRELVMVAAAVVSLRMTPKRIHEANAFGFGPIKEVGFLFIGIFLTMIPALGYIAEHGSEFGLTRPLQYYVMTGFLSSVLDNAPTYATFFELSRVGIGATSVGDLLDRGRELIVAVSLGAVFFGAMTYIGNGPNFMVKAIADSAGVKTPGFFAYIFKYSVPVLLPILLLVGWLSF